VINCKVKNNNWSIPTLIFTHISLLVAPLL
jgi:hypothetical protein